jgi:hypothetical protein
MVKVKTSPDSNTKKITIADLNQNILNLTKTIEKSTLAINKNLTSAKTSTTKNTNNNSSSSNNNDHSWYYNAGSAAWHNSSMYKYRGDLISTGLGSMTGISPAIVQRLGIDKAIGSIFKSTLGGIRKKWLEAGFGQTKKTKINSAIEANKVTPITKRLDKIYGLLKSKKTAKEVLAEKKEKGFFGKLLSFFGSILSSLGPLLKLGAAIALGKAIWDGVKWLINKLGGTLGEDPLVDASNIKTVKDIGMGAKLGVDAAKAKTMKKLGDMAETRSLKKEAQAGAYITKAREEAKRAERARELAKEAKDAGNAKRAQRLEQIADAKDLKAEKNATKAEKSIKQMEQAKQWASQFKNVGKTKSFWQTLKTATKLPLVGTAADIAINEAIRQFTDDPIEQEILRRQWKEKIKYNAIGTAVGGVAGGIGGAAAGGVGAVPGAAAGAAKGYVISDLTLGAWSDARTAAKVYREHGMDLPVPEKGKINPIEYGTDWYYYTRDQLKKGDTTEVKKKLDDIWGRTTKNYYDDKEYKGNGLIEKLPDGMLKDWAYRLDHGIGSVLSAIPESIGIGSAYIPHWLHDKKQEVEIDPSKSVSYPEFTTPVYGLTTDFKSPIAAADLETEPVMSIATNTRTTNELLQNIYTAIQDQTSNTQRLAINGSLQKGMEMQQTAGNNQQAPGFPALMNWMQSHGTRG